MRRPGPALALLAAVLLALGGCGGDGGGAGGDSAKTTDTETTPQAAVERPLEDSWYEDPDGDGIPTHTELRIGSDPQTDGCIRDLDCPGVKESTAGLRAEQPSNTLLMLDSSGSMRGPAGDGKQKIVAAKASLERFVVGTPDSTKLGLLVYGHKGNEGAGGKARSCRGVEILAPLGEIDYRNAREVLARFKPRGHTPIARALAEAERAFAGKEEQRNRIVLVSDGVETCDGDPVEAARQLNRAGISVIVDVVGFDIARATDVARLKQIADVTGGTYTGARSGDELLDFIRAEGARQMSENRALGCIFGKGNALAGCRFKRLNDAAGDMFGEQNAIFADLFARENKLSARLFREANQAQAAGDELRAERLNAQSERETKALSDRRERITKEIARIRDAMETRLKAEIERDEQAARRRERSIERESAEVERRLKARYGES